MPKVGPVKLYIPKAVTVYGEQSKDKTADRQLDLRQSDRPSKVKRHAGGINGTTK